MKVLFFNSIFPNAVEPTKGNFIVKNLAAYPMNVEIRVLAPVPFGLASWRKQGSKQIPLYEELDLGHRKLIVYHPRFPLFPRNFLRPLIPWLEYMFTKRSIHNIYRTWPFDLLHANFGSPDGIAAAYHARKLQLPLVITEHQAKLGDFLQIPYLRRQYRFAYHTAKRVISVSQFTAGLITQTFPDTDHVQVITNGVDFARFQLRKQRPNPHSLIYIGYLVQHKGIHILLEALAIIKPSGLTPQLSIVGDGEYRSELQQLAQKLGLNNQVHFLGEKTPTEVAALLPEHDFMVHPSFIESFGIVMVEALASGLPVLSTFNGGAQEIVNDDNGLLVSINNPQALAEGIKAIYANWQHYDPQKIRNQAQERFDIHLLAQKTCEVYQEVLCSL